MQLRLSQNSFAPDRHQPRLQPSSRQKCYNVPEYARAHIVVNATNSVHSTVATDIPTVDSCKLQQLQSFLEQNQQGQESGVYAIFDEREDIQYVGASYNIAIQAQMILDQVGEDQAAFIRVHQLPASTTKDSLQEAKSAWLAQFGTIPPGNGAEQAAFGTGSEESYIDDDAIVERGAGSEYKTAAGAIVSPFTDVSVHRYIGEGDSAAGPKIMTVETVDQALNEIRPYLIQDGGDVSVKAVEDGIISLQLQGACGSCPSSTATMQLGIEKALKAAFGEQLKDIVQVASEPEQATVEAVDSHLDQIRPALANYGGAVEVLAVEGSKCVIKYQGTLPIRMGVEAAIKDRFPNIREIEVLDLEEAE